MKKRDTVKALVRMPVETSRKLKTLRSTAGITQAHVIREGIALALEKYAPLLSAAENNREKSLSM